MEGINNNNNKKKVDLIRATDLFAQLYVIAKVCMF